MKKIFSEIEIEIILLQGEDIITASGGETQTTSKQETTATGPVDTGDDLPWDVVD